MDVSSGGQNTPLTSSIISALPSIVSDDRRSPSESSNVSAGNAVATDIKDEPIGRTNSRNSMTTENKNDKM